VFSEALGKKDSGLHIKISRKEAKECRYWLRLLDTESNGEVIREKGKMKDIYGKTCHHEEQSDVVISSLAAQGAGDCHGAGAPRNDSGGIFGIWILRFVSI
jgi:hypothetical protein